MVIPYAAGLAILYKLQLLSASELIANLMIGLPTLLLFAAVLIGVYLGYPEKARRKSLAYAVKNNELDE